MQRALLLINPGSRRGRDARAQATRLLEEAGLSLIKPSEENPENFPELVRRFRDRVDLAIVGGGDGTMRGLLHVLEETQCPLGVLPLGTANNLARNLGIPLSLPDACAVFANAESRRIDLGRVNGEYFLNVAGLGLSTQINAGIPNALKKRWGVAAYGIAGLKLLRRVKPFDAEIECDGKVSHVHAMQITVCNGRHFGAGMTIHPEATISDERLDLCSFEAHGVWQALALFPSLLRGRHHLHPSVKVFEGKNITIRTRSRNWIDTDGEITTHTPAEFTILPNALEVIVPCRPPATV